MRRALGLAAIVLLAGCNPMHPVREPPPRAFVGTKWHVILELPLPGEQPWIVLGDGRLEGFAGCNRINARYLQDTVGARAIAFRTLSSSKRGCDTSVMAAESRVLEVLQSVSSYSVTGDTMTMTGSAGTLNFKAEPLPVPPPK
jgi:hypothetical protein